jgi:hypothetical protein
MNIQQQICNFELNKKLKELGVNQESTFYWEIIVNEEGDRTVTNLRFGKFYDDTANKKHVTYISAFTATELGAMLPDTAVLSNGRRHALVIGKPLGEWQVGYREGTEPLIFKAETEADARAKMLIYLIEQGIVKP